MSVRLPSLLLLCALAAGPAPAAVRLEQPPPAAAVMPATDRPWSAADYAAAANALRQMEPDQLPRLGSPVMRRLIAVDNLSVLQDRSVPVELRVGAGLQLVQSTTDILKLYLAALLKDPSRSDDVVWLEALMMQEASMLVGQADEIIPTLDPKAADYQTRVAGQDRMKQGLAQLVNGCILMLEARAPASASARVHLAEVLKEEWPRMAHFLPPQSRAEFEVHIARIAENDADPKVKAALAGLAQD